MKTFFLKVESAKHGIADNKPNFLRPPCTIEPQTL